MPQVIVIDEIGTELEAQAARTIAERGVQLIGTAHGNNLDNLMLNPTLSDLIGGIQSVTLGDEEARRRRTQKSVLERKAPPTFDVIVEIQDRERVGGPRRRRRHRRRDAARRPGRARSCAGATRRASTDRQGRPRPSPREQLGARAVRRPRRRRARRGGWSPAGAATARYRDRRLSRGRPRRRASGPAIGPARPAAGARRAAGPAASRRPRGPIGGWPQRARCPGERFAAPPVARRRARRRAVRRRRHRRSRAARAGAARRRPPRPAPARPASSSARRRGATRRARAQRAQGRGGDRPGQRRRARGRRARRRCRSAPRRAPRRRDRARPGRVAAADAPGPAPGHQPQAPRAGDPRPAAPRGRSPGTWTRRTS